MPRRTLLAPTFVLCAAALGRAQEPAAPAKPEEQPSPLPRYEESVEVEAEAPDVPSASLTALKTPAAIEKTPLSVSLIPRFVFEGQHASLLGDALRNAAGVNVATGFGVFDFFVIRGFDSLTSGLVLTDGAPEPESSFYPLYNVGRVEVLKGPGAFLYGGNPTAGAVHLLRKQPRPNRFGEAALSYGRFDTLEGTLDANLARRDGSLAFRLNAVHRRSDSYRDDKQNDLTGVNPVLSWRPDARTTLSANLEYVRSDFEPDTGVPVIGGQLAQVPRTRSYQSPFDVSRQDTYRARLDAQRLASDTLTLRGKLYYTDLDWRSDGTLLSGVVPNRSGGLLAARAMSLLDDRQKLFGAQAEALASFSTGNVAHQAIFGLEASRLGDVFNLDVALLPAIDVFAPVETASRPLFLLPGLSQTGDARSRVLAAYAVDRVQLARGLELFAGARLDALDYDDPATRTERSETRVSPLLGLVCSPVGSLSFYASAATAFAPPSTLVVGPRDPEESRQLEAGVKARLFGGRGRVSFAAYHLERDGIAIPDATGVLRQSGDQRSRGVELELSAEVEQDWLVHASYAASDAKLTRFAERAIVGVDPATFAPVFATVDRSGNWSPFAPRHLLSLWTLKRFGRFELGGGARYVGRQYISEDNAFAIPGYTLLDATAGYRVGRVKWSVNLQNLTDAEYETRGSGAFSVIPGRPFAVFVRAELGLGAR
jgi:TonB-dependent siderophore receptor